MGGRALETLFLNWHHFLMCTLLYIQIQQIYRQSRSMQRSLLCVGLDLLEIYSQSQSTRSTVLRRPSRSSGCSSCRSMYRYMQSRSTTGRSPTGRSSRFSRSDLHVIYQTTYGSRVQQQYRQQQYRRVEILYMQRVPYMQYTTYYVASSYVPGTTYLQQATCRGTCTATYQAQQSYYFQLVLHVVVRYVLSTNSTCSYTQRLLLRTYYKQVHVATCRLSTTSLVVEYSTFSTYK